MKRIQKLTALVSLILLLLSCSQSDNSGLVGNRTVDFSEATKKIGVVSDLFKYPQIIIDDSQVYIWDKFLCKVRIYSLTNLTKIAEFGKRGQGPMEFSTINDVSIDDDYIYVNSHPKLSIFLKDGTFVKELKATTMAGAYKPVGENFIARKHIYTGRESKKGKRQYVLFDSQLNKLKDIYEVEYIRGGIPRSPSKSNFLYFKDCTKGIVYKNRFYIGSTDRGYFFAVFDENGNKLYEIDKDYKKRTVTSEQKNRILNALKSKSDWAEISKKFEVVFPDYLPPYINFSITNNKIYVFKIPESGAKTLEVDVLDLTGNLVKHLRIPASTWKGLMDDRFYFSEGKIYYVESNRNDDDTLTFFETTLDN